MSGFDRLRSAIKNAIYLEPHRPQDGKLVCRPFVAGHPMFQTLVSKLPMAYKRLELAGSPLNTII